MSSVKDTVDSLRIEFKLWQGLLLNCKERPADCLHNDDTWTLKDILAHLTCWQQVTLARLLAARLKTDPEYPFWLNGADPDSDDELERINARIYEINKDQSLAEIKKEWELRFSEILLLSQLISEQEYIDADRYSWLKGSPLLAVLEGTLMHHREHRDFITSKKNPSH